MEGDRVIKVSGHIAVKYGYGVTAAEAAIYCCLLGSSYNFYLLRVARIAPQMCKNSRFLENIFFLWSPRFEIASCLSWDIQHSLSGQNILKP